MSYYLYVTELSGYYLDKMLKKIDNGCYFSKVMFKNKIKSVNQMIKTGEPYERVY